ncbi:hypothetical protein LINGRAHAP2_LOCUS5100, partial [Linum grandiflorum]
MPWDKMKIDMKIEGNTVGRMDSLAIKGSSH